MPWGKSIKRNKWDKVFSDFIRERDNWTCQRCGKFFPESRGRGGLHNSHFFGRRAYATRFDEMNCEALCYGCHSYLTANPEKHREHKIKKIGQDNFDRLLKRNRETRKKRDYENPEFYALLKEKLKILKERKDGKGENDKSNNRNRSNF